MTIPAPKTSEQNDFHGEFQLVLDFLQKRHNFAFLRFSDGELYMMQNRRYKIEKDKVFLRGETHSGQWGEEELKEFIPEEQQMYREKLIEAFECVKPNYIKGISCRCCVGQEDFMWQADHLNKAPGDNLTWANLLINGNYSRFIEEMVPEFANYNIVYVCNEAANVDNLPFDVKKTFRVGNNCHVNNYDLIQEMKNWIGQNGIEDHLFLFSAGTLSNFLIYDLFSIFAKNIYMDIGSTLNPLMEMTGWVASRAYLRAYWLKEDNKYINMKCVW